ncbi:ATP-binding cassette domain-containing protein [Actinomadura rudentiformis]|uniref:ATP-binding cassette domain-containing protein n=1 Tax=Actinomadura rudentiformis TaxID=359158 RepID=A0A6H9YNP6_9ACTN|nr:ATP-binding cassette domain-containing protein [Actinomadura rudentiformis]KAB2346447.1 ATP-binding cassette domain-containing protein [Actinomadura rudentiformis]
MRANVIEVRELQVRLGESEALRGVSFAVAKGEIYALLGGHGAGKTTLLEVVAGTRRPTSGIVRVRGADPYCDAVRSGAVWRDGGLFPGLTVAEVVDTWRRWTLDPLTRDEALRLTGLGAQADVPFERLGTGERRLLDLALALVGQSDVVFLDEPTAGLGEHDVRRIWSVLRFLAANGVTVLLATRDVDEACRADRIGVMDKGRLPAGQSSARVRAA